MNCPYKENLQCTEVNTSSMSKIECKDCEHYDKGIKKDEFNGDSIQKSINIISISNKMFNKS